MGSPFWNGFRFAHAYFGGIGFTAGAIWLFYFQHPIHAIACCIGIVFSVLTLKYTYATREIYDHNH